MGTAVKYSLVAYAILCIATLAESGLISASFNEALTGVPSLSPSKAYSRPGYDHPTKASFNLLSPTPVETRSAIPTHYNLSNGPSALRSARPSSNVRSERPCSNLSTQPSHDMYLIPTQHSTIAIFPTAVPTSLNRSGFEQAGNAADTSSSPERKKGFVVVLVVGMFSLLATAVALLSHVVRRRSLGEFERRRESERGSCVQDTGANPPSLEHRRPAVSPIGSDEWLAGLGSLPSSTWMPGTNQGEDCESCHIPRSMSFRGSDETSGFDLESYHSSTTNESWSGRSTQSTSVSGSDLSEPLELVDGSSAQGIDQQSNGPLVFTSWGDAVPGFSFLPTAPVQVQ